MNSEDLIAYLLHETAEEERLAFSEKWMSDPELHEQLKMAEAELLDAYVREEVGPERRRRIETYLLGSDRQRRKLQLAQSLHQALPRWRAIPWAAMATAACIVLASGAAWLATENSSLNRQLAEARLEAERQRAAGPTFELTLPNDAVRGAERETSLALPPSAQAVRLELGLEPADRSASAEVEISLAGRIIWSQHPVPEQSRDGMLAAIVWIPSQVLAPGRYEVKLSSNGSALAYYHFNITPRAGR